MKLRIKKGLRHYGKDLKRLCATAVHDFAPQKAKISRCAIVPDDYEGLTPRLDVREGDTVSVGSPLFHDKTMTDVTVVSPMAGTVKAIVRGERRHIDRIEIEAATTEASARQAAPTAGQTATATLLARSGLLAMIRQRPFDIVPDPAVRPRDIFVTAFDSAPLAPELSRYVADKALLDTGVKTLRQLTDGKVYVSVDASWPHGDIAGAEMVAVDGCHPAGNAGVQAANIAPVNKGETVWVLDIVTLYKIGEFIATGKYDPSTLVWVAGTEIERPGVVETVIGADVATLLAGRTVQTGRHVRIISGNVLTGTAVSRDEYLRYPYRQLTVIAEGDDVDEFMGWAPWRPQKGDVDARLHGSRRAMILSGAYDSTMPMDILPEYLIKAIISRNFEEMERLGIYEVAPEDFAVCEYVDASKLPLQQIVRDGLDYMLENS